MDEFLIILFNNSLKVYFYYRSQEWTLIPENERKDLGLTFSNDGEFW